MLTLCKMPAWASNPGVLPATHPAIHSGSHPHILPFIQSPIPTSDHPSSWPANSIKTSNFPFAKVITGSQRRFNTCYLFSIHSKTAHTLINMQSGNRGVVFNSEVEPTVLRSAENAHWYEWKAWWSKMVTILGFAVHVTAKVFQHRSQSRQQSLKSLVP